MMLLKGGLHTHTTCSGGKLTPQEVADAYHQKGFDFIAFTDHDHLLKAETNGVYERVKSDMILFPGLELTVFVKGYVHVSRIIGEKVAQDRINGLGYAMACVLSGHDEVVLLAGHCKESQSESRRMCTNLAYDPFYCRPLGIDFTNVNTLQARAYMAKSQIQVEHLARIVVRSRENRMVTEAEVMQSTLLADPIRELHHYPVTDWAVAVLLCKETRAREFTDRPGLKA